MSRTLQELADDEAKRISDEHWVRDSLRPVKGGGDLGRVTVAPRWLVEELVRVLETWERERQAASDFDRANR